MRSSTPASPPIDTTAPPASLSPASRARFTHVPNAAPRSPLDTPRSIMRTAASAPPTLAYAGLAAQREVIAGRAADPDARSAEVLDGGRAPAAHVRDAEHARIGRILDARGDAASALFQQVVAGDGHAEERARDHHDDQP